MIALNLTIEKMKITLINIYTPNEEKPIFGTILRQEAQWTCIAHLVCAIYIVLYQSMTKGCYTPNIKCIQTSDSWKNNVSSFFYFININ